MGKLLGSFIFPHPPIVLPEIGMGKETLALKTIHAMEACSEKIAALGPDTIIITTPHGPMFSDYVFMSEGATLSGDFSSFGHKELKYSFANNLLLSKAIKTSALQKDIQCGDLTEDQYRDFRVKGGLDHGALVPLYYIGKKLKDFKLVHISIADFSNKELYSFGMAIKEAISNTPGNFVFVASGDLSHKFSTESPYGFSPKGPEFDQKLMDALEKSDILGILSIEASLCREAAECGMKSFIMMLGANDCVDLSVKILSHEGPFGIGYGVVELIGTKENKERNFLEKLNRQYLDFANERSQSSDPYVKLASMSLEYYLRNHASLTLDEVLTSLDLPVDLLHNRAGVFVSIKKHGQLRGCIGTISPVKKSIADEIITNAISAGVKDYRFNPIALSEFNELVFSVDVLSEAEPIPDSSWLDVKRYGVIVENEHRRGLLLPNLEGVDTVGQQIEIALSKAGISKDEKFSMERFEVVRHK